jgi:PiT family inorganic phosphate transporter
MEYLLIVVALFLAFGNGANDNFKGFATVWGSDTLSYRQALLLATAATLAGSMVSLFLAQGLVQQFSGRGLVPDEVIGAPWFLLSVATGAALTVIIATVAGLPVSTTHALIGGLVGAGMAAGPDTIRFAKLGSTFFLPLLASPVVAAGLGIAAFRIGRLRTLRKDCACIVAPDAALAGLQAGSAGAVQRMLPQLVVAEPASCDKAGGIIGRVSLSASMDRVHIASAAMICFARSVNDTPKLAALLAAAHLIGASQSVMLIALAMAAGGVICARRVAETMSCRLSRIDSNQGIAANLITATLVLVATKLSLPVSTTHVAIGAIAGAGASTLDRGTLRSVLLAWVATMPLAAAIAWTASQAR